MKEVYGGFKGLYFYGVVLNKLGVNKTKLKFSLIFNTIMTLLWLNQNQVNHFKSGLNIALRFSVYEKKQCSNLQPYIVLKVKVSGNIHVT